MPADSTPPPSPPHASDSVRRRVTALVFLIVFLDLVGFGLIIPLLPFYVESMGGTATTVGVLLAMFSLAQLFATPLLGRLSDRVGRRPIILLSLVGNALSMFVFALATEVRLLPVLFASRLLAGATAGNLATCQAAVADVSSGSERAAAMGRVGAGIGLGMVLGPVMGSQLHAFGAWVPPLLAGVFAAAAAVGVFFLMPETHPRVAHARQASGGPGSAAPRLPFAASLAQPGIRWVLALYFLTFLGMTNLQVSLGLLAQERFGWGERQVGHLFALNGMMTLIVQGFLIGRLTRRVGQLALVTLGAVLMGTGMGCIALAQRPFLLLLAPLLVGGGMGLLQPVLASLASSLAGPHMQGGVLGVAQASGGLARVVGPVWSGFLYSHVSPAAPFLSGMAAAALSLLLEAPLRRRLHAHAAGAEGMEGSAPARGAHEVSYAGEDGPTAQQPRSSRAP